MTPPCNPWSPSDQIGSRASTLGHFEPPGTLIVLARMTPSLALFHSHRIERLASVHVLVGARTPGIQSALRESASTLSTFPRQRGMRLQSRGTPVEVSTKHRRPRLMQSDRGVSPNPRQRPRPPVLPTRRVPAARSLRIPRPLGSIARPLSTDRWKSTLTPRTDAHSTLPVVLGVTACVDVHHLSNRSTIVLPFHCYHSLTPHASLGSTPLASWAMVDCSTTRLHGMKCWSLAL